MEENFLVDQQDNFLDESNPQHFINLVPPRLKQYILDIPKVFFTLSEKQLISRTYTDSIPEDMDFELRLSFFDEYESCFKFCKKMSVKKICQGTTSQEHFYHTVVKNPGRLTFIITEPARIQSRLKYGFHLSLQELIRILKSPPPISPKTGLPDPKFMELKIKAFEYLDQRLHGSLIQRQQIESKNVNVNINTDTQGAQTLELHTPDAIDRRLAELESELAIIHSPNQAPQLLSPMERVEIEAGKVVDAEFQRERKER